MKRIATWIVTIAAVFGGISFVRAQTPPPFIFNPKTTTGTTISSPAAGACFRGGSSVVIAWVSTDPDYDHAELSYNAGAEVLIAHPATVSPYRWTAPSITSSSVTVKVESHFAQPDDNVTSQSITGAFGIDSSGPSAPKLAEPEVTTDSVALTWSASTDPGCEGLVGYKIFRNGVQIAVTTSTSYTDSGLAPGTAYSYKVVAYDDFSSAESNTRTATTGQQPPSPPPPSPIRKLTVIKSGDGAGSVTSGVAGIDCGSDCSESYDSGTKVTLAAHADPGSAFDGWTGDCLGIGEGVCEATMDGNKTVTAKFRKVPTYKLTVNRNGDGTVTSVPAGIDCGSDCAEMYDEGAKVTLIAEDKLGAVFESWSGDCLGIGKGVCQATMTKDLTITANFKKEVNIFKLTVAVEGGGSVVSNPPGIDCGGQCQASYNAGDEVTLTAKPGPGREFDVFTGGCFGIGKGVCKATMDADMTVIAKFKLAAWTKVVSGLTLVLAAAAVILIRRRGLSAGKRGHVAKMITETTIPGSDSRGAKAKSALDGSSKDPGISMDPTPRLSADGSSKEPGISMDPTPRKSPGTGTGGATKSGKQ